MRRDYGSELFYLIDQPQHQATRLRLMAAAVQALINWEPRITITRVDVLGGGWMAPSPSSLAWQRKGRRRAGYRNRAPLLPAHSHRSRPVSTITLPTAPARRDRGAGFRGHPGRAQGFTSSASTLPTSKRPSPPPGTRIRASHQAAARECLSGADPAKPHQRCRPSPTCWPGPGGDLDNLVANWKAQRLTIQPGDDTATPPVPEIKEDDEALILRAMMAWDGLSVAGPTGAYEYFALGRWQGGRRQRLQPSPRRSAGHHPQHRRGWHGRRGADCQGDQGTKPR